MASNLKETPASPQLLRVLGAFFGLAVGIGSMIGAGILRTPGSVASSAPSFWWILGLWAFAAAHAILSANIAAEVFTSVPRAGGPYVIVRKAFGDLPGLLVGASDVLNNAAATAAMSLAAVDFLVLAWPAAAERTMLLAIGIIAALFTINAAGVKEGRTAQIAITAIKIGILLLIASAALLLPPAKFTSPPLLEGAALAGTVAAYQLIFGAYSGWLNPVYFVEEDVAPARNIPRVLFGSILGVAAMYLLINLVLLRVMGVEGLASQQIPVGALIGHLVGTAGPILLGVTGFILIIGCCHAGLMVAPRIVFGLARDGLLPRIATQVSRAGTPQVALALVTSASVALTATGTFDAAFRVVATTGVAIALLLDMTFFALRIQEPALRRPYRARAYPWLPLAVLLLDAAFFVSILWFDPLSGMITVGTLGGVSLLWLAARRMRLRSPAKSLEAR